MEVTRAFFQRVRGLCSSEVEALAAGHTLKHSSEETAMRTAKLVGMIQAYNLILNEWEKRDGPGNG